MAIGDYTKTTYVNNTTPAINATNLNNAENKIDEIDKYLVPPGTVSMYAGSSAPTGWLICNGSAISRTTYSSLFTAIGTAWGVGDGSSTFNIPDMRESAPVGVGTFTAVGGTTHGSLTAHDAFTLAQFKDDQEQGHYHNAYNHNASGGTLPFNNPDISTDNKGYLGNWKTLGATDDGTNGVPRIGTVTRGKRIGINFIIKA